MTLCITCQKTKVLPRCSTQLTIGLINHISQLIYIFVENVTTGYRIRQEATSSATGVVNIDMTDPARNFFSPNMQYEVWVTFRDTSIEERVPISLGASTFDCFSLEFETFFETTNVAAVYATYQLQLDSTITIVSPIMDFDTNDEENVNLDDATPANVERWINRAQNNDAIQTIAADQPAITAAGLNGQNTFTFANDHFAITDFSYTRTHFHFMILLNATPGANRPIFGQGDITNAPYHFLQILAANELQYVINDTVNIYTIQSTNGNFFTNWVVIEAIFENSHIKLFANGEPLSIASAGGAQVSTIAEISEPLIIGGYELLGTIVGFTGQIRCWKIWDAPITATQRQDELLKMLAKV